VNAKFYCNVLCHLREKIRWKQPELWCAGNWVLNDDNAPSHQALITRVSFSPTKALSHFRIRLIHQIWPLATSSSSRRWSCS
jgi:hypothetical protein